MKPPKKTQDYTKFYSENDLFKKLKKASGSLGGQVLYYVLVLYFLIADKSIPMKVRIAFIAALGYFILPTDLVTDFLPVIGYTDDLALLTFVVGSATNYITPEIKEKAETMRSAIVGDDSAVSKNTGEDELA